MSGVIISLRVLNKTNYYYGKSEVVYQRRHVQTVISLHLISTKTAIHIVLNVKNIIENKIFQKCRKYYHILEIKKTMIYTKRFCWVSNPGLWNFLLRYILKPPALPTELIVTTQLRCINTSIKSYFDYNLSNDQY